LQLAARMLQTTRESVIQVASEVGYDSEAAFNRAFKREFGVPPGQFRRQFKGQFTRSRSRPGLVGGDRPIRIPSGAG